MYKALARTAPPRAFSRAPDPAARGRTCVALPRSLKKGPCLETPSPSGQLHRRLWRLMRQKAPWPGGHKSRWGCSCLLCLWAFCNRAGTNLLQQHEQVAFLHQRRGLCAASRRWWPRRCHQKSMGGLGSSTRPRQPISIEITGSAPLCSWSVPRGTTPGWGSAWRKCLRCSRGCLTLTLTRKPRPQTRPPSQAGRGST